MPLDLFIVACYFAIGILSALPLLLIPKARAELFSGFAWHGFSKTSTVVFTLLVCTAFGLPTLLYLTLFRPPDRDQADREETR